MEGWLVPSTTIFFNVSVIVFFRWFLKVQIIIVTLSALLQLLVCLRMLIRRCVYENTSKDDIPKLFPGDVLPELQNLLTLLLHKFQQEWHEDVLKDQVSHFTADFICELDWMFWSDNIFKLFYTQNIVPRLKAMTWNMTNQDKESTDPAAAINLKVNSASILL